MLENILKIGATFDWISPLLAVAQDLANGPSHTFLIPATCGRSGREIANLLRQRGVKTWGHMVINDTLMISVPETQARWAQYLLDQAGIPTGGAPADQPQTPQPQPQSRRKLDRIESEHTHSNELRDIADYRLW